jgi:hypothetical protein
MAILDLLRVEKLALRGLLEGPGAVSEGDKQSR